MNWQKWKPYLISVAIALGVGTLSGLLSISGMEKYAESTLKPALTPPGWVFVFAASAYIMILIAMTHVTNVSYVQAFRQLSLPISVLLGVMILKEKITLFKIAAIGMILGGLLIIYLG